MDNALEPKDNVEKVMKIIWENELTHNSWKELVWNEYPLSDSEADQIRVRLRKTATEIIKTFPNGF